MADLTTDPVKFNNFKLDLQTKWHSDDRFTHEKLTNTPTLKYYFTNNTHPHRSANTVSRFSSQDEIVTQFKQQCRDKSTYWGRAAEDFWQVRETRKKYETLKSGRRVLARENEYTLNTWYEQDLEDEIRKAIARVEAKYQKKFVKHIDDKIQMADPLYAFVKSKETA
jgi:hypothetical protein